MAPGGQKFSSGAIFPSFAALSIHRVFKRLWRGAPVENPVCVGEGQCSMCQAAHAITQEKGRLLTHRGAFPRYAQRARV